MELRAPPGAVATQLRHAHFFAAHAETGRRAFLPFALENDSRMFYAETAAAPPQPEERHVVQEVRGGSSLRTASSLLLTKERKTLLDKRKEDAVLQYTILIRH